MAMNGLHNPVVCLGLCHSVDSSLHLRRANVYTYLLCEGVFSSFQKRLELLKQCSALSSIVGMYAKTKHDGYVNCRLLFVDFHVL